MSKLSNCFKVHPDSDPGPCVHCGESIVKRYVHLKQKLHESPDFCRFISHRFNISEIDCICRNCDKKFQRLFSSKECPKDSPAVKKSRTDSESTVLCFLSDFGFCEQQANHKTQVHITLIQQAFGINVFEKYPIVGDCFTGAICHVHYNKLNRAKNDPPLLNCIICN